jgi:hypothetical protein
MAPAEQYNCNKIAATAKGIVDLHDLQEKNKTKHSINERNVRKQ